MDAFGTVLIAISVLAVLAAALSYWGSGGLYRRIGREGGLDLERDRPPETAAAGSPEAVEEIRQLLEAKYERLLRQGKQPLDVEAEVERQLRELGG